MHDVCAPVTGCAALGALYRANGNHEAAVQYFEKFFELARAAEMEEQQTITVQGAAPAAGGSSAGGPLRLADTARAALGIARANAQLATFADVVRRLLPFRNHA